MSEQDIAAIMREEKAQTRDTGKVTLPAKEIEQFFPKSYTPAQKKKVIVKLLDKLGTPAWRAGAIISLLVIATSWYNIGVSQNVA